MDGKFPGIVVLIKIDPVIGLCIEESDVLHLLASLILFFPQYYTRKPDRLIP
jgi:hypothetical protein